MPDDPELRIDAIARVLHEHGVEFVVIGGVAAILQGAPLSTLDIDIVPDDRDSNLDRLGEALVSLNASISYPGSKDKIRSHPDGSWLRDGKTWNLDTDLGRLDLLFGPAGAAGFDALALQATETEIAEGLVVLVASVDDLIAMKEASNREKDRLVLPMLRWLRDRAGSP